MLSDLNWVQENSISVLFLYLFLASVAFSVWFLKRSKVKLNRQTIIQITLVVIFLAVLTAWVGRYLLR